MKVRLSDRLSTVYDMVTDGSVVADVGCDHAFLSIALVENGKAPYAYALDINKGPLEKAAANIASAGLKERVHTVLSDGLSGLCHRVDSVVICGMGGSLIISIIDSGMDKVKKAREIILSPQSDAAKVRMWLKDHDFSLKEERAVIDAEKYYEIIKVVPSCKATGWGKGSAFEMKYGPYLIAHHDLVTYEHIRGRIHTIEHILGQLDTGSRRYNELKGELEACRNFVRSE